MLDPGVRLGPYEIVSIVGAVKAADALRIWEDQFGAWIGAQVDRGVPPSAPRLSERREKRVDLPGKSQSDLVLGFVGPTRSAPDYLDVRPQVRRGPHRGPALAMPNRLAGETSPYLQQHADNPVDWYPWSQEALAKAKREGRRPAYFVFRRV